MRLIDADAIIKKIKERNPDDVPYEDAWAITCIEHAPTIDPERKTGKWIKVNGKTAINCSICHHCCWSLSFEDTVKRFNFCPMCGAKMERK